MREGPMHGLAHYMCGKYVFTFSFARARSVRVFYGLVVLYTLRAFREAVGDSQGKSG